MSRRIGVCFSADFWDEGFDYNDRLPVINVATKANWHWFINLTKHPERIPAYFMFPKNWIQGVTINRKAELQRMNYLKDTHATTKFISFEPLYEDLGNIDLNGIDWIIIGAQTHPDFQPKDEWVERLIYQADNLDIPVFTKNNLPVWNLKEYPYKLAHSPIT